MKTILIYGDSNTWGDNMLTNKRIPREKRWPTILEKKTKTQCIILQEGLPGRLAGKGKKTKPFKNGKKTFELVFKTNSPLDVIIVALGTNDLLSKHHKSARAIIRDLEWYSKIIEKYYNNYLYKNKYFHKEKPKILYIMPTIFFDINSRKSNKMEVKRKKVITYFEKSNYEIIISKDISLLKDNIHFDYRGHEQMAKLVYDKLNSIKILR